MFKFSKNTIKYAFEYNEECIYQNILNELKKTEVDWGNVKDIICGEKTSDEDIEALNYLKKLYLSNPQIAIDMYQEMIDEEINEKANQYLNKKKASNEQVNISKDIFHNLYQYFDEKVIEKTKNLIHKINPDSIKGIINIGILNDHEKLGLFCPDYDQKVKNIYLSKTKKDVNKNDIINSQNNQIGISFLVNPKKIKEEAMDLLPKHTNARDIKDLTSIVLGEIIVHEASHTKGEGTEDIPVLKERNFLNKALNLLNENRNKNQLETIDIELK